MASNCGGLFNPLNISNLLNNINNANNGGTVTPSSSSSSANNGAATENDEMSSPIDFAAAQMQQRWTKAQMDAAVAAATILLAITGNNGGLKQQQDENSVMETDAVNGEEPPATTSNSSSTPTPAAAVVVGGGVNIATDGEGGDREALSPRGNQWMHLGTFDSETEMQIVRNKEKVSKRRTEQLKNGVKVRYRCNTWKRTKCGFQMFSFQHADSGLIELYECGTHDHSGRRKIEYDLLGPLARRKATPLPIINGHKMHSGDKSASGGKGGGGGSSPHKPPKQLRMMAEQRALTEMAVAAAASVSAEFPDKPWSFSLTESAKLDDLRTMARQHGLRLERNSDIQLSIYRLSVNGGRGAFLLVVVDSADAVTLTAAAGAGTIFSPSGGGQQRWEKADWTQFLWAIRAVFAHLMSHCQQQQQQQAPQQQQL
ncbi:hypothetical protein niasHS_003270 [Heterodera schachtii]|uniref:Uncharacterized protein n=1 Tax=Heterodera schachtii TaxID=97005 RepID=A0ABD2KG36_HETSC